MSQDRDLSLIAPSTVSEISGRSPNPKKIKASSSSSFVVRRVHFLILKLIVIVTNTGYPCFVADMDDDAETYKLWRVRKTIMQVWHTRHQLTRFPYS